MSCMLDLQAQYQSAFDELFDASVFGLETDAKNALLFSVLHKLHCMHMKQSKEYKNISLRQFSDNFCNLQAMPYIAVRLFKLMQLQSIPADNVYRILQSSGTTSQVTAKVVLDKLTSQRQSKVLVRILQTVLGKKRLPMLIIDAPATVSRQAAFSARAAGIQGLSFFGRNHTYALNDDMSPNWQAINDFAARFSDGPVMVFGFTFMVWQYLINAMRAERRSISLPEGVLLHSGGWKSLEREKVDNETFKHCARETLGVEAIHNFYGMAEQVGSIFLECSEGHIHAPSFADIVVRNPDTLNIAKKGEEGILQVLSSVPSSYPGHSILTEDVGTILGEDDCPCGWKGKYFSISGRLPKTELRGCSDTHAQGEPHE